MEIGYTMLANGRGSDWGQCLLIDECLGKVILGESHIRDLPEDLIKYLAKENVTQENLDKLEDKFFNQNGNDGEFYYTLSNLLYKKETPYVVKFSDIGDLANYVRLNDIHVDYHIEAD